MGTLGYGLIGAATTKLARTATRRAMHLRGGAPRLPRAARQRSGLGMLLMLAAAAGAILAIGDVVQEQRKHIARA